LIPELDRAKNGEQLYFLFHKLWDDQNGGKNRLGLSSKWVSKDLEKNLKAIFFPQMLLLGKGEQDTPEYRQRVQTIVKNLPKSIGEFLEELTEDHEFESRRVHQNFPIFA